MSTKYYIFLEDRLVKTYKTKKAAIKCAHRLEKKLYPMYADIHIGKLVIQ